jgi:hypothetical protein
VRSNGATYTKLRQDDQRSIDVCLDEVYLAGVVIPSSPGDENRVAEER